MGNSNGKDAEMPMEADPKGIYTQVTLNSTAAYILRSDGIVARSCSNGVISQYMVPPSGVKYTAVSCAEHTVYLLRDDGNVDRSTGSGKVGKTLTPSDTSCQYIAVSSGPHASYLVRSDGAVDRLTGSGNVTKTMNPPPGERYLSVSAGAIATYLVRSDGKVDRSTGKGDIHSTLESSTYSPYIAVGEQLSYTTGNGKSTQEISNMANYLLRKDGIVDRTQSDGKIDCEMKASIGHYVACAAGISRSLLVRSDGAIDVVNNGEVAHSVNPTPGTKYLSASVGVGSLFFYVIVDDGSVVRYDGRDAKTLRPPGYLEGEAVSSTNQASPPVQALEQDPNQPGSTAQPAPPSYGYDAAPTSYGYDSAPPSY